MTGGGVKQRVRAPCGFVPLGGISRQSGQGGKVEVTGGGRIRFNKQKQYKA